ETLGGLFDEERAPSRRERDTEAPRPAPAEARAQYRTAAEKGLLKILSKMGISTLSSYCGAQIFEVLGLGHEVITTCFAGTASPLGGIGFEEIAEDVLARHHAAHPPEDTAAPGSLPDFGRVRFRKEGEDHGWAPPVVVALQQAVKAQGSEAYGGFLVKNGARRPAGPRDLLTVRPGNPISLDEVEPAESIRRRFIS